MSFVWYVYVYLDQLPATSFNCHSVVNTEYQIWQSLHCTFCCRYWKMAENQLKPNPPKKSGRLVLTSVSVNLIYLGLVKMCLVISTNTVFCWLISALFSKCLSLLLGSTSPPPPPPLPENRNSVSNFVRIITAKFQADISGFCCLFVLFFNIKILVQLHKHCGAADSMKCQVYNEDKLSQIQYWQLNIKPEPLRYVCSVYVSFCLCFSACTARQFSQATSVVCVTSMRPLLSWRLMESSPGQKQSFT